MSRKLLYKDNRLVVEGGIDPSVGNFIQIFDNNFIEESDEGEGPVFDYDDMFGTSINYTGYSVTIGTYEIVCNYVKENKDVSSEPVVNLLY